MNELKNKVVVITGAGDGLGKRLAFDIGSSGAKLALVSKTKSKLDQLMVELNRKKIDCQVYLCDISEKEQVRKTIGEIIKKFGRVDILINDAGIYYEDEDITKNLDLAERMIHTNTLGTVYFTENLLPLFLKQKQGQILNVISIGGLEPNETWGIYASSKYAITGYTESLRKRVEKINIKVMGVYPEGMDTNIFNAAGYDFGQDYSWMMHIEDVSRVIVFMLTQPEDILLSQVVIRKKTHQP